MRCSARILASVRARTDDGAPRRAGTQATRRTALDASLDSGKYSDTTSRRLLRLLCDHCSASPASGRTLACHTRVLVGNACYRPNAAVREYGSVEMYAGSNHGGSDSRRPSNASTGGGYNQPNASGNGFLGLNPMSRTSSSSYRERPNLLVHDSQYGYSLGYSRGGSDYGGGGDGGPGPSSRSHSPHHAYPHDRPFDHRHGHASGVGAAAGPSRKRKSGLKTRTTQLMALRFGWIVLVIWYEVRSARDG